MILLSLYVLATVPYKLAKGARILLGGTNNHLNVWEFGEKENEYSGGILVGLFLTE